MLSLIDWSERGQGGVFLLLLLGITDPHIFLIDWRRRGQGGALGWQNQQAQQVTANARLSNLTFTNSDDARFFFNTSEGYRTNVWCAAHVDIHHFHVLDPPITIHQAAPGLEGPATEITAIVTTRKNTRIMQQIAFFT